MSLLLNKVVPLQIILIAILVLPMSACQGRIIKSIDETRVRPATLFMLA